MDFGHRRRSSGFRAGIVTQAPPAAPVRPREVRCVTGRWRYSDYRTACGADPGAKPEARGSVAGGRLRRI